VNFLGHDDPDMHHGMFGGKHAEHEFHNLPIEPYHGIYEKIEHD